MLRNRYIFFIPLAALILFLDVYFIYNGQRQSTPPPRKPAPEISSETSAANWYIEFSVKNQKFTAYTEADYAPVSAAGQKYFIGSGAVHPRHPLQYGGNALVPIIPFGTTLYLHEPITVQGQPYTELTVNDTGDVYFGLWPSHPYWVDVYYGTSNYYNQESAREAGVKLINYTWYEAWPDE